MRYNISHNRLINTIRCNRAQAMVEFVIILSIIMILCSGMLYASRLLSIQYWAQQEARLMAFEQTWVHELAISLGLTGGLDYDDHNYFRRPYSAKVSDADRDLESNPDREGMDDLLNWNLALNTRGKSQAKQPAPTMLARRGSGPRSKPSLLKRLARQRSPIYRRGGLALIGTAFATQGPVQSESLKIRPRQIDNPRPWPNVSPKLASRERSLVNLLQRTDFGGRFCRTMNIVAGRHGGGGPSEFTTPGCAVKWGQKFGAHLASNVDVQNFFREYGLQIKWGLDSSDALQITAEKEIATQFYSFFDQEVKEAFNEAVGYRGDNNNEASGYSTSVSEARYVGSNQAMNTIQDLIDEFSSAGAGSRADMPEYSAAYDQTDDLEAAYTSLLFEDADEGYVLGGLNGFWLDDVYNAIPLPSLTAATPGIFDFLGHEFYSEEDDSDKYVSESSKWVEIEYDPTKATFEAARRRFRTSGKTIRGKFYLLTQPWHISRRQHEGEGTSYRELGTQFDDMDAKNTEEAVLRRRVFGMYIIPTEASAGLRQLSGLFPGELDFIDPLADVLEPFDWLIKFVKNFVVDNPINDIIDFLQDVPLIGDFVSAMKLPEWPAVRPQAYPHSTEIEDDRTAGESREFYDFVTEQKEFCERPKYPDGTDYDDCL